MSLSSFGVRRVSRRFDIFRIAARPRAALISFGLRHVLVLLSDYGTSVPFLDCGTYERSEASTAFIARTQVRVVFLLPSHKPLPSNHGMTESRNDPATRVAGIQSETCVSHSTNCPPMTSSVSASRETSETCVSGCQCVFSCVQTSERRASCCFKIFRITPRLVSLWECGNSLPL